MAGVARLRKLETHVYGMVGHLPDRDGNYIDSWTQSSYLAKYWREHIEIPRVCASLHRTRFRQIKPIKYLMLKFPILLLLQR